jgi:hypothetical protein
MRIYTEKVLVPLTKGQKENLLKFANQLQIPVSQLVRSAVNTYLSEKLKNQTIISYEPKN